MRLAYRSRMTDSPGDYWCECAKMETRRWASLTIQVPQADAVPPLRSRRQRPAGDEPLGWPLAHELNTVCLKVKDKLALRRGKLSYLLKLAVSNLVPTSKKRKIRVTSERLQIAELLFVDQAIINRMRRAIVTRLALGFVDSATADSNYVCSSVLLGDWSPGSDHVQTPTLHVQARAFDSFEFRDALFKALLSMSHPITRSILNAYFPRVYNLQAYLNLALNPPTDTKINDILLLPKDPPSYGHFLVQSYVSFSDELPPTDQTRFDIAESFDSMRVVSSGLVSLWLRW